jgi:phage shock protein PspC (stress-responsive transcriptional regulator)
MAFKYLKLQSGVLVTGSHSGDFHQADWCLSPFLAANAPRMPEHAGTPPAIKRSRNMNPKEEKTVLEGQRNRRLVRRDPRVLGGVCRGIAEHFGISSVVVRTAWLVSVVLFGTGLIAYFLMWALVPAEEDAIPTYDVRNNWSRSTDDRMMFGVCGGIASRIEVDPGIVRVLWAIITLGTAGLGLAAYLICALVMPEHEGHSSSTHL